MFFPWTISLDFHISVGEHIIMLTLKMIKQGWNHAQGHTCRSGTEPWVVRPFYLSLSLSTLRTLFFRVYHQVVINFKCLFHDKTPPNLSQTPEVQSRRLGMYGLRYACVFLCGQCLSARNTQDTPVTPRLVYWLVGTRENPYHRKPFIILIESAGTTSKIWLGLC